MARPIIASGRRSASARPIYASGTHRSSANRTRQIDQGVSVRNRHILRPANGRIRRWTDGRIHRWANGLYSGPNGPVGARPATARPATPNWPKAAAALALAASSTALADAKVRGRALSAISPILNIAGPRFFILLPNAPNSHRAGALAWQARYYKIVLKRATDLVRSSRARRRPMSAVWNSAAFSRRPA